MTILGVQRQLRELGRLRLGGTHPKGYPISLDSWRLTSPNPNLIDAAAQLWGGTPEPWKDSGFQVITETDTIPVRVAPQIPRPEYALWSQAGKQRSCDGETAWVASDGGVMVEHECLCDPQDRECKPSVLVKFFVPDLPDIGVWVYTSTAYTAVRELVPAVEMMAGTPADLSLVIEQREVKRPGQPVKQFAVATLRSTVSLRSLLEGGGVSAGGVTVLSPSPSPALPSSEAVTVLPPEPSASPEELGEVTGEVEVEGGGTLTHVTGGRSFEEIAAAAQEQAWVDLLAELEEPPSGTMDDHEIALRSLFRRMEATGLWSDTALHDALGKRGFAHVGDMKKAELVRFCEDAWTAAKEAVANAE